MNLRAELLQLADLDAGELLADNLYSDIAGFKRLLDWSGNPQMALATIKDVVRNAARYGRDNRQVQSWSFFRSAIVMARQGPKPRPRR